MAYRVLSVNQITLTKKIVTEFAEATWAGERDQSATHVAWLKIEYEEGRFIPPTWTRARILIPGNILVPGTWYRVDGQHSSNMLKNLSPFPKNLEATVREIECDTESDLVTLHSIFDQRRGARDSSAYAKSVMATDVLLFPSKLPAKTAHSVASGIAVASNPDSRLRMSALGRARLLNECPEFIVAACHLLEGHKLKVGLTAAMYLTWQVNDLPAWTKFWTDVLEDLGDAKSPARTLHNYLQSPQGISTEAIRTLMVKCLHAWNAYRHGSTTALSYYRGAPVPKVV